jgi:hypothetical protein
MAQGHHADRSGQSRTTTAYAPAPGKEKPPAAKPCGCGCGGTGHKETSSCCDTECFERPRYFCGHLLTDADLSLEQHYVVAKHKLYHRALDGYGIACGLRLTCHPDCAGYVMIGEGFGIDDCGNDLVACEPMPFDVIGTLRRKNMLYGAPPKRDDCKPGEEEADCVIPQCYYVVACYEEQPGEYSTPLTPACGSSPRDCEPTRIRETIRFDVVDKLPKTPDPLRDLEHRIRHCFALFTDGPFADLLAKPIVREALDGQADSQGHEDWCNLICGLRILFKRYLECHPDHYNCTLGKDLDAVCCPPDPKKQKASTENYSTDVRTAVCRIVELAYSHVMACVMGELAFSCPEPAHASCIVLGTVEVESERVMRVCNCPRTYVWSFGSFWQVAMANLFGSLACKSDESDTKKDNDNYNAADDATRKYRRCGCGSTLGDSPCCQEFKPQDGCEAFIRTLTEGGRATPDLATGMLEAIDWIRCSVQHTFDPTRTDAVLLRAMRGRPLSEVRGFMEANTRIYERGAPTKCVPWGLIDALDMAGHATADDRFLAYTENGVVMDVVKQGVQDRLKTTEGTVETVERELHALRDELEKVKAQLKQYRPPPSGGEPGPGALGRGGRRRPSGGGSKPGGA